MISPVFLALSLTFRRHVQAGDDGEGCQIDSDSSVAEEAKATAFGQCCGRHPDQSECRNIDDLCKTVQTLESTTGTKDAGRVLKARCKGFCETTDQKHEFCKEGLSTAAIVGIAIGSLFILGIIFLVIWSVVIHPRLDRRDQSP